MPCSTCGTLPDRLVANTGRDDYLPPEAGRLLRDELADDYELRRCPECDALFEWQDDSQMYGSGNNDEERLERLTPAAARIVRVLLGELPEGEAPADFAEEIFRRLSDAMALALLWRYAARVPEQFDRLTAVCAERCARYEDERSLCELLGRHAERYPAGAAEMRRILRTTRYRLGFFARVLRDKLEALAGPEPPEDTASRPTGA